MFWIIGGVPVIQAAAELTGWSWLVWLSSQMHHTKWHGFTFYDLIFPLFLFLAGVAMPLLFSKRLERGEGKIATLSTRHRARITAGRYLE